MPHDSTGIQVLLGSADQTSLCTAKRSQANARPCKRQHEHAISTHLQRSCCRSESNSTNSLLLALPPEIRNRIWRLVVANRTIHVQVWTIKGIVHWVCVNDRTDRDIAMDIKASNQHKHPDYDTFHRECCRYPLSRARLKLSLLRVCRQVYDEAALLPFKYNTFSIESFDALVPFLKSLVPSQARAIKSITLPFACDRKDASESALIKSKLSGLQHLTCFVVMDNTLLERHFEMYARLRKSMADYLIQFGRFASLKTAAVVAYNHKMLEPNDDSEYPVDYERLLPWAKAVEKELLMGTERRICNAEIERRREIEAEKRKEKCFREREERRAVGARLRAFQQ